MSLLPGHGDLFADKIEASITPWKPRALAHAEWPPNYSAIYAWRIGTLTTMTNDAAMLTSAKVYYKTRPGEFIMHWMDTYNPRLEGNKWIPFVFFQRQYEFIEFLENLRRDNENGLVEKCRDIGATWLACAYSVWSWLFLDDDATGWGTRKQELVDKLGDPDSIFEKIRLLIKRLPSVWLPQDYRPRDHSTFMKLLNPENGATVTGESGDNIGRGGRKSRYFKDEAAHYERPEKIEAALGDNTNVQIDMSSVNGLGNVFHRRRENGVDWAPGILLPPGKVRVFVFDWRDHPEKTQEWYDLRKARFESEGLQHVFAQEVDRNYSAAIGNTIISAEWLAACVDAHLEIPCLRIQPPNEWMAGLDVADKETDGDRNALALRQWIILRSVEEWGERDQGVTTRRMVAGVRPYHGISVQYDPIGIGAGVKTEYNRLIDDGLITREMCNLVPWNAGASVVDPWERIIPGDDDSIFNKDFFGNFKAQAWWSMRTRCYKTWRARTLGDTYPADQLISFDSNMPLLHKLTKELAQATHGTSTNLRMIVNKKPDGTTSPNLADATVQCYFPAPDNGPVAQVGVYSG